MSLSNEERENLVAYLDGELDEEASQILEAKLTLDPQARAEVDALRQTWGLLDYLPRAQPSTSFTHQTMERLALAKIAVKTGVMPRPRHLSRGAKVGWAAAVLLALGGGVFGGRWWFKQPAETTPDVEETLVRHLRVLEQWRSYEHVDDLEFLRALNHADLFGDDS